MIAIISLTCNASVSSTKVRPLNMFRLIDRASPGLRIVTTQNQMQISVIVPVRNEEGSIGGLLESLLNQTLSPSEIVITDGGSTDATTAIIQKYIDRGAPVRLIRTTKALPGRARNLAAARATNEWLAFTDAGIKPAKQWLESLAARASADSSVDVVYGSYAP